MLRDAVRQKGPSLAEMVGELGRGSFVKVHKVVHLATGLEFAMKVMEKRTLMPLEKRWRCDGATEHCREHAYASAATSDTD